MFETPEKIYLITPVWGKEFTRFFSELVVPNLAKSNGLRKIFSEFDCTYLIYSDEVSIEYLKEKPEIEFLRSLVEVQFIDNFTEDDIEKYGRLTLSYNNGISRAASVGAALIFLNADMLYSSNTFDSLINLIHRGKRSVEIEGFRVDKEPVERDLRANTTEFQVDARYLVGLAMQYPHSISRSHFWEEYPEDGFMPFHTYWRVGDRGLLARASHIYPLYLYSRDSAAGAAKTIDWDLVDTAKLHPAEIYIVKESDEIFAIECSNESYHIVPAFKMASLDEMREFVRQHCTPEHRERLRVSIHFRRRKGGTLSWLSKEAKARLWYACLDDDTLLVRSIFILSKVKKCFSAACHYIYRRISHVYTRVYMKIVEPISRPIQSMLNKFGVSNVLLIPESVIYEDFYIKTGYDPSMYIPLIEKMTRDKRKKERKEFLLTILNKNLTHLFELAPQYCLEKDRDVLPIDTNFRYRCGESFAGNKWKRNGYDDKQKYWRLNSDDSSEIYIFPKPVGHYRIEIEFLSFDLFSVSNISISTERRTLDIVGFKNDIMTGSWILSAILPVWEILAANGPLVLYIGYDSSEKPEANEAIQSISVALIEHEAFGPLFDNSRSFEVYQKISRRNKKLSKMMNDCPSDVLSDPERAGSWVESMDAAIHEEMDDSVSLYAQNLLSTRGLSFEYYSKLGERDGEIGSYLSNCPVGVLTDPRHGDEWLETLEDLIRTNIFPAHATNLAEDRLYFSEVFIGSGWGNVTKWGDQSYRSFGAKNTAVRIKHPGIGTHDVRIRTYIFSTIPNFLDSFKIKVNGVFVESQVIWLTDRFAVQFDLDKSSELIQDGCILIDYEIDHPLASRYFDSTSFSVLTVSSNHSSPEKTEDSPSADS